MNVTDEFVALLSQTIFELLENMQRRIQHMAVSQTQFDPDLTKLGTDTTALISLVGQLITALQAAQKAATTPDDLTAEDTAVNAMDSAVQTAIAQAQAALKPS
jgi:hypothetical protein